MVAAKMAVAAKIAAAANMTAAQGSKTLRWALHYQVAVGPARRPPPLPQPHLLLSAAAAGEFNLQKFSQKITLQKQRQAEETAAFKEVMMELGTTWGSRTLGGGDLARGTQCNKNSPPRPPLTAGGVLIGSLAVVSLAMHRVLFLYTAGSLQAITL